MRPIDELRAELRADPATQAIARRFGLQVEDYVEKVLDYALHPERKPTFEVVPDGVARANGAATTLEVKQWLADVAAGSVELRGEYEQDTFER